jgi:hypothetical protein
VHLSDRRDHGGPSGGTQKSLALSTFGAIEPGANCAAAKRSSASLTVS